MPFGLRVPVGATMIGPVLPGVWMDQSELQFDSSQTAFLAIDGIPGPVVSNVIEQAQKRGFVGGVGCSGYRRLPGHVVTCTGSFDEPGTLTSSPLPASARCVAITVDYGACDQPYATIGPSSGVRGRIGVEAKLNLMDGVDFHGVSKPHFTKPVRVGDPMLTGYFAGVHVEPGQSRRCRRRDEHGVAPHRREPRACHRLVSRTAARDFDHPFFKLTGRRAVRHADGWRIRSWASRDQEGDAFILDVLQKEGRTYVVVHQLLEH